MLTFLSINNPKIQWNIMYIIVTIGERNLVLINMCI